MSFCSPEFGVPMSFFLSPSSWTFPLRQGSSLSLLILPGLLRSDRGGLSVSSPSGKREDACGLRRWRKFPALEFYSASFLHWISLLSYPYLTTLYIFNYIVSWSLKPSPLRIPWIHRGWTPASLYVYLNVEEHKNKLSFCPSLMQEELAMLWALKLRIL